MFRAGAVTIALAACELALQGASGLIPAVDRILMSPHARARAGRTGVMIPDAVTGWRGNPAHPAHDRLGFNNSFVPDQADLVTLGDSLTYGVIGSPDLAQRVGVSAVLSWPAVAGELSGLATYNMGLGGWGPVEYLDTLNEALTLNPKAIAMGFYFGNDLVDAFRAVYARKQHTDMADPAFAQAVAEAEDRHSLLDPVTGAFRWRPLTNPRGKRQEARGKAGAAHQGRTLLSNHCKLYGLARAVKDLGVSLIGPKSASAALVVDDWTRALQWARQRRDRHRPFEGGSFRTVFAAPHRHSAVNHDDPRIRAGLAISLEAIHRLAARCRARNVDFFVVLLPTKELVFEALVDQAGRYPKYQELVDCERLLRREIIADLAGRGIACVDTLDALRACFGRGEQPYAVSADGHPNAIGYHAIATAVADHLRSDGS